jgi:hypothetical protein
MAQCNRSYLKMAKVMKWRNQHPANVKSWREKRNATCHGIGNERKRRKAIWLSQLASGGGVTQWHRMANGGQSMKMAYRPSMAVK